MPYIELDPAVALKAIEGYTNELDPEARTLDAFYRQHACPRCKGACRKEIVAGHAFSGDSLVPRSVLRCETCSHLFDPHSGITLEMGHRTCGGLPIIEPK